MFGGNHNRILIVIFVLAGLLIVTALVSPDLALQLRTQIPPQITQVTKTLTWTPGLTEQAGDRVITITATDDQGESVSRDITITVEGGVEGISDVEIIPERSRATLRWKTTSPATPRADFDLNNQLRKTVQEDTAVQQTDHELTLDNLVGCTSYVLQIKALLLTQALDDVERSFTTLGCTGDAPVRGVAKRDIPTSSEQTIEIPGKIAVRLPAGALPQAGHAQVHQLDRDQALGTLAAPSTELSPVTGLYEISTYADAQTKIATLNQPAEVTVTYTPAANTDVSTLALWRHDGTSWSELSGCTVDTGATTVTCTTSQFSAVAGFAAGASTGDEEPEPTPQPQQASSGGGDSGGGGGGGGGGGDSSGGGGDTSQPARTFTYQVETGHKIEGPYSDIIGSVAKLASNTSLLSKRVSVPAGNYYLDVKARHDRPGPVRAVVYLDNYAWKVFALPSADDQYRTHRVGLLRNFSGSTIRFRLINDNYNKAAPGDESQDRNLFIDWWRLTTDQNAPASATGTAGTGGSSAPSAGGRSAGWSLLPNLNSLIRQELGNQHVRLDVWRYYARRLTLSASDSATIQSEDHLRTVMRYWKGVRPSNPKGDSF